MITSVKMDSKGRISIPQNIRKEMGLKEDTTFWLIKNKEVLTLIEKRESKESLIEKELQDYNLKKYLIETEEEDEVWEYYR